MIQRKEPQEISAKMSDRGEEGHKGPQRKAAGPPQAKSCAKTRRVRKIAKRTATITGAEQQRGKKGLIGSVLDGHHASHLAEKKQKTPYCSPQVKVHLAHALVGHTQKKNFGGQDCVRLRGRAHETQKNKVCTVRR